MDNAADPCSILEFLEPSFAGLVDVLVAVFISAYGKQLFCIINYKWMLLGYHHHTFGWISSKNVNILPEDDACSCI